MPPIDKEFLNRIFQKDFSSYPLFVETGTCTGATVLALEPYFKKLYTIEIQKHLQQRAVEQYSGSKIEFINGDSSVELERLAHLIDENTVFFLDAHLSGGETGRGSKDCPLIEEINSINNNFKHKAILIIDDFRLFETNKYEDWSDISKQKIINILDSRILQIYHLESEWHPMDRLIIHINSTTGPKDAATTSIVI